MLDNLIYIRYLSWIWLFLFVAHALLSNEDKSWPKFRDIYKLFVFTLVVDGICNIPFVKKEIMEHKISQKQYCDDYDLRETYGGWTKEKCDLHNQKINKEKVILRTELDLYVKSWEEEPFFAYLETLAVSFIVLCLLMIMRRRDFIGSKLVEKEE